MSSIPAGLGIYARQELARRSYGDFLDYMFDEYDPQWFHRYTERKLDAMQRYEIMRIIISQPPQTGKSTLCNTFYAPYLLGKEPDLKIALSSYNHGIAQAFSRLIRKVMQSEKYRGVFPDTRIKIVGDGEKDVSNRQDYIEVVGRKGSFYAVGMGGGLTSKTVDFAILDDPIKGAATAYSDSVNALNKKWLQSDLKSRLHNKSRVLVIQTRWTDNDPAGVLINEMKEGGDKYEVIVFQGIKEEGKGVPEDPRQPGEALWEEKHSRKSLMNLKNADPVVFQSLQQSNPGVPPEVLIFNNWIEIEEMPAGSPLYGCDPGLRGKFALVEVIENKDGVFVDLLIYADMMSTGTQADRVKTVLDEKARARGKKGFGGFLYVDSAAAQTIEDFNSIYSICAVPAKKGPGSVMEGISDLRCKKVHYTSRSTGLKEELENYRWVVGPDGKPIYGKPVDNWNHAMDAIRYALSGDTWNPPSEV